MLAQPFVKSVTTSGEISLIFFAGEYSHSVLKTPKPGDFRVQEEHGGQIKSFEPDREIIEFAIRTLRNVPGDTLFARVDVVLLSNNQPALMEVELIEPSLYLSYNRQSPKRFTASADHARRRGHRGPPVREHHLRRPVPFACAAPQGERELSGCLQLPESRRLG